MTTVRLIRDLEEVDHRLSEANERLKSINDTFGDRTALSKWEEEVGQVQGRLREAQRGNRTLELEAESTRGKLDEVEAKLYGGAVRSPRELEGLTQELQYLREGFRGLQDRVLESMLELEEAQERLRGGEAALEQEREGWDQNQTKLAADKEQLEQDQFDLEMRREEISGHMEAEALQLYERVRREKGGQVVARVERELCRSCGVTLPTHLVQRVRPGKEPLLCPSCGRILYSD